MMGVSVLDLGVVWWLLNKEQGDIFAKEYVVEKYCSKQKLSTRIGGRNVAATSLQKDLAIIPLDHVGALSWTRIIIHENEIQSTGCITGKLSMK